MAKVIKEPFCALYPVPVVLVTCLDKAGQPNVIAVSWVGTVSSTPPSLTIGLRPHRYSHAAIEERSDNEVTGNKSTSQGNRPLRLL